MTLADIFAETLAPKRPVPDLANYGIERLSYSLIDSLTRCPEQFRRERIVKEPRFATAELLFGSVFHRAAEHNYRQKQESHEDIAVAEMRDVTGDSFNEILEETKGTEEIRWYDSEPGEVQSEVITAMVGRDGQLGYHQVLAPTVQPVAVERWVEVPTALGVPLVAKIDIETDALGIIDLKTGKRARTQLDLDSNTQASAYLYVRREEGNPAAGFGWHVAVRTKKPQQQELMTTRTDAELATFERLMFVTAWTIQHYMETYGPDEAWPGCSPLAFYCSPTQCSFWSQCLWRGGAR